MIQSKEVAEYANISIGKAIQLIQDAQMNWTYVSDAVCPEEMTDFTFPEPFNLQYSKNILAFAHKYPLFVVVYHCLLLLVVVCIIESKITTLFLKK